MFTKKDDKMANNTKMMSKSVVDRVKRLLGKYRNLRLKKLGLNVLKKAMPTLKAKKEAHLNSESKRDVNNNGEIIFKTPTQRSNKALTTVCKQDFDLEKVLGVGGFGSVYLAKHKRFNSNKQLAVKVLKKPTLCKNPAAQFESFKAEQLCLSLRHKYVVKTFATTSIDTFDSEAWVVMEYAGDRTLQKIIDDHQKVITCDTRLKFAFQLSAALKYLHENDILHLDVKPCNIMIANDGNCKLGDFGCSQKMEYVNKGNISPTQRSHLTGTFAYRAPELLRGEAPSTRADVYGLGITLWQMLTRESPYGNENQHVVIFSVVAYGKRPPHPEIEDSDAFELCYRDLYSQCWEARSDDRPSSKEVVDVLKIWKSHM